MLKHSGGVHDRPESTARQQPAAACRKEQYEQTARGNSPGQGSDFRADGRGWDSHHHNKPFSPTRQFRDIDDAQHSDFGYVRSFIVHFALHRKIDQSLILWHRAIRQVEREVHHSPFGVDDRHILLSSEFLIAGEFRIIDIEHRQVVRILKVPVPQTGHHTLGFRGTENPQRGIEPALRQITHRVDEHDGCDCQQSRKDQSVRND